MNVVNFLTSFVTSVFVETEKVDFSQFREKALQALLHLVGLHGLTPIPSDKLTTKEQGTKAVSHNSPARFYVRMQSAKIPNVPIVAKPLFDEEKTVLYGYVLVPDSTRIRSLEELESFARVYMSDAYAKHEQFVALAIACTSRQMGEDISNNTRQDIVKRIASEGTLAIMAAPFLTHTDDMWKAEREALLLAKQNRPLVAYIDEHRPKAS